MAIMAQVGASQIEGSIGVYALQMQTGSSMLVSFIEAIVRYWSRGISVCQHTVTSSLASVLKQLMFWFFNVLFPGLTQSLVDSFFDPSETVAHAISKALKDIARKKPIIVLRISGTYLKKHVKVCTRFICIFS